MMQLMAETRYLIYVNEALVLNTASHEAVLAELRSLADAKDVLVQTFD